MRCDWSNEGMHHTNYQTQRERKRRQCGGCIFSPPTHPHGWSTSRENMAWEVHLFFLFWFLFSTSHNTFLPLACQLAIFLVFFPWESKISALFHSYCPGFTSNFFFLGSSFISNYLLRSIMILFFFGRMSSVLVRFLCPTLFVIVSSFFFFYLSLLAAKNKGKYQKRNKLV